MTHTDLTETLAALVRDFLDPDPCQLDHHGYCQAHSWLCEGRCPHARAREVLAEPAAALPAPVDRAAVLREAADAVFALEYDVMVGEEGGENLGSMREAWDVGTIHASQLLRRMADQAQPEPGARHVHITIHHPDPTTATTAALCIADLIRGEYSDSHRLTITTDAQDVEVVPHRLADESPGTESEAHAPLSEWRVEILDGDEWMPASGLRRDRSQAAEQLRLASERRPLWADGTRVQRRLVRQTTTYTVEPEPAVGARQDERADDVVTELTEAEFHTAAGRALARLGLTYAELEDQARRRDFSSAQARSLWVTIGGAAPAGARQDGEAQ